MSPDQHKSDLLEPASIETRQSGDAVTRFWQSLEEVPEAQCTQRAVRDERATGQATAAPHLSRRDALKIMSASAAFAGLTACTKLPTEKIVPYVVAPEEFTPGIPLYYATAMGFGGEAAIGLLAESHMGRPTKIEGNPDHPGSLGATDIFAQASVLMLYDPDRSQSPLKEGRIGSWGDFLNDVANAVQQQRAKKGAGLRVLTETVTSPALGNQLQTLLTQLPGAKWHQYEPVGRDAAREGGRLAYGEYVNTVYRFDQAEVVLSLDSDFLCAGPGRVRYARDFMAKRRITGPQSTVNRLYAAESTLTITGSIADHRVPLSAAEIEAFALNIAGGLGVKLGGAIPAAPAKVPSEWITAIVQDLQQHRGSSIVIAGDQQPPSIHALAHAINEALGNVGTTIVHTDPLEAKPVDAVQSIRELTDDIQSGNVDFLVILGGDPAFNAPVDLEFAEKLLKAKLRIHLGPYNDETAQLCHWHIPETHFLESWSDARGYDGSATVVQPLIAPLYGGRSAHEIVAVLLGQPGMTSHDVVHDYWKNQRNANDQDFEVFWQSSLEKGLLAGTALPAKRIALKGNFGLGSQNSAGQSNAGPSSPASGGAPGTGGVELVFRPDPTVWDGRFANVGWLQELPKPFTKLTWDNAALVSLNTARKLAVKNEDVVSIEYEGREVRAPIFVVPGLADDSVTLHLGYGRPAAGRVGAMRGFNAYSIRTSANPWFASGARIRKTGGRYHLVNTQTHFTITGEGGHPEEGESAAAKKRKVVRGATLEEFRKDPDFASDPEDLTNRALTLYKNYEYNGYAWGMSIDLNSCIGCSSCVVACQAENNIPVVGKAQVDNQREMQWIRVDSYYEGDLDNPRIYHEPVPCMHCENAPCELVCPVGATVHDDEGLNEMVYNRCVGTRYCSNNCPYKVRRFNFMLFSDWSTPSLYSLRNPNVTVRSRGVMEKCTYCIQRINTAKIRAEEEDRRIEDSEVLTACQQSCPTQAIVFGDINDRNSQVARLKQQSRDFGLLRDLNTRPRTTYLAKLTNPNPAIKA
jgi:molybdopterin-containing oxidoreductase family iron-sulfur binding subunit